MAGSKNNTHYSAGYNFYPVTAADISLMQNESDATQIINVDGDPEGAEAANPGSMAMDRTNGDIYKKSSGTGNTGWELLSTSTGTGDVSQFDASVTEHAIARYSDATGLLIENSLVTISDAGVVDGATQINVDNLRLDGNTISSTDTNGAISIVPDGTGNINVTADTVRQDYAGSGSLVEERTYNSSGTSLSSAEKKVMIASSDGEARIVMAVAATQGYAFGLDNNDSASLKISYAGSSAPVLSVNNYWKMTSAGEITMPLQPAFLAYLGTQDSDVTGNAAVFTLGSGNALTEVFDQGSDFVTTGVFTSPVTARYPLWGSFYMGGITAAMTFGRIQFATSNRNFGMNFLNAAAVRTVAAAPDLMQFQGSTFADMDASDTASISVRIDGGAGNDADVLTSGANTFFAGNLEC